MAEAGLIPPDLRAELQASLQHERSTRLPDDVPSNSVSNNPDVELRLKRKACKGGAPNDKLLPPRETAWKNLMVSGIWHAPNEKTMLTTELEPWKWNTGQVEFRTNLQGIMGKNDAQTSIEEATDNLLKETREHDIVCYTDGSAEDGTKNGGAGGVIYIPGEAELIVHKACGTICSSYRAVLMHMISFWKVCIP